MRTSRIAKITSLDVPALLDQMPKAPHFITYKTMISTMGTSWDRARLSPGGD